MSGPGWHCDGCGAYMMSNGIQAYRVTEEELRIRLEHAKGLLARAHGILEMDPKLQKLPSEIAAFLGWPVQQASEVPETKT